MEIFTEAQISLGRQGIVKVPIYNARLDSGINIERNGFQLMHHSSVMGNQDFYNEDTIRSVYYPELSLAVKTFMCASDAICFQHHVRNRSKIGLFCGQCEVLDYVETVHIDYGLGQAEELLERTLGVAYHPETFRYQIINAWRSISDEPVKRNPLAVEDTQSPQSPPVTPADEHLGDIAAAKWYCYPLMRNDEVLLFKQHDSHGTLSDVCYHTSFEMNPPVTTTTTSSGSRSSSFISGDHPEGGEEAARESIETRLILSYPTTNS
jgi:hypothetical protein